jgi:hypothetical protein
MRVVFPNFVSCSVARVKHVLYFLAGIIPTNDRTDFEEFVLDCVVDKPWITALLYSCIHLSQVKLFDLVHVRILNFRR